MRTVGFRALAIFCVLLAGCAADSMQAQPSTQSQEVVVEGTLVGHDGQPMSAAHVSLYDYGLSQNPFALTTVLSDGSFRLTADTTGVFSIWLTGAYHHPISIPFLGAAGEQVTLDVQLETYRYADEFDDAEVIGDFNEWDFDEGTTPLKKQETGTYKATVPAEGDSLAYQLVNVDARHRRSINGTMTDRYVYDRRGDYRSVVAAPEDSVTVTFDPAELVRDPSSSLSVTFPDSSRTKAYMSFRSGLYRYKESSGADRRRRGKPMQWDEAVAAGTTFAERHPLLHDGLMKAGSDTLLRSAMFVEYTRVFANEIEGMAISDGAPFARRMLEQVAPSSLAWNLGRGGAPLLSLARFVPDEEAEAYLSEMKKNHPDADRREKAARFLKEEYMEVDLADVPTIRNEDPHFRPFSRRSVRLKGARIMQFKVNPIGEDDSVYTSSMFKGKMVLISAFASWCTECIQTLTDFRPLYEKHREDFAMLNVSFEWSEKEAESVVKAHSLPGLHGYVQDEYRRHVRSYFKEVKMPLFVLVGPNGYVLDFWESLEPETVGAILERVNAQNTEVDEAGSK